MNPVRILANCAMPDGKFDFVVKTPDQSGESAHRWLRQAVETAFGLHARRETRDMPVYILSAPKTGEPRLTVTVSTGGSSSRSGPGGRWGGLTRIARIGAKGDRPERLKNLAEAAG